MADVSVEEKHPIFTKDPSECLESVGKEVCVTTQDGQRHQGTVYTIDPVSESVVLVRQGLPGRLQLEVVMGHALKSLEVTGQCNEAFRKQMDTLFKPRVAKELSGSELKQRQSQLRSWLLKNRIPVNVSPENAADLIVADTLYICPPYDEDSCRCTNEIVLGRIQGLIKNMPKDEAED